jgi:hypothetical protein
MAISYLDKAKELKKLGLIDFAIPRKGKEHHLTPSQKGRITKAFKQNSEIIKNPQGFQRVSVSRKTARAVAPDTPLQVKRGKKTTVYIPKEKNETVKMLKGGVIRRRRGDYEIKVYPAGWNMLKTADKLFARKLKRNEFVTAQIGTSAHFNQTFTSKIQLMNYLQAWQPKDKKYIGRKDELIAHFSLVKVRNDPDYIQTRIMDEFEDEDEDEDDF